ncbi:MAG: hypothetical protein J5911_04270 [Clostridia bacterium]|nr:hypothetical protein [Clostridia bacterium]
MADNKKLPEELNAIPANEYNSDLSSDKEYNDISGEFAFAEERQGFGRVESNPTETSSDKKSAVKITGTSSGSGISASNTSTLRAVQSSGTVSSVLYKIALGFVALTGVAIIGANYIPAARTEDAKFIEVTAQERTIEMELEVLKWSDDLKIKISGKDFTDEIKIENREKDFYQYDQDYYLYEQREKELREEMSRYWTQYYVENGEDGDEILLEIIGNPVFMNEVLDSKTVVLKIDEPQDPDDPPYEPVGDAKFISVETYDRYVYMQIEVTEWSEYLKLRVTYNGLIEYIDIVDPNGEYNEQIVIDDQEGDWITYYAEYAEDGDYISLEIVGKDEVLLDVRRVAIAIEDEYSEKDQESETVNDNTYNGNGCA